MSPRFVLGRENVPYVAEVVNRSLKADCTDFNRSPKAVCTDFKLQPADFETSKIYQGNFQSLCSLAQLFLDTLAVSLRKKSQIVKKIFSSSENAIWTILLKYQELNVQVQASLTKIETSYIVSLLNGINCRFVEPEEGRHFHINLYETCRFSGYHFSA